MNLRCIETIETKDILGEGILWRNSDRTIWWTDIKGKKLHCFEWQTRKLKTYCTPEGVCAFSFIEGTNEKILTAFESGLAFFTPESGGVEWLDRPNDLRAGVRLNDGRTDPAGRFWVGSMTENEVTSGAMPPGTLYKTVSNNELMPVTGNIHISNGLCWSPDGKIIYFADSLKGEIYAAPYNTLTGLIGIWRLFAKVDCGGSPDGAITDAQGYLWSAIWGSGCINRYNPDGLLDFQLELNVLQPTCVCFGGENNSFLFVSSARLGLDKKALIKEPLSGSVFVFETDVCGNEQHRFIALTE